MFVETIIACLAIGAAIGFGLSGVLIVDPMRRERNLFRDRIIQEQMRTYAAQARLAAHRMLSDSQRRDNEKHSLRVVQ